MSEEKILIKIFFKRIQTFKKIDEKLNTQQGAVNILLSPNINELIKKRHCYW